MEVVVLVTRPEHGLDFLLVFVAAEPLFDALVSAHDDRHHHRDDLTCNKENRFCSEQSLNKNGEIPESREIRSGGTVATYFGHFYTFEIAA